MSQTFRFRCPKCARPYKANKDLGGRLKRCGKCHTNFMITEWVPPRKGAPAPAPAPFDPAQGKPPARLAPNPELAVDEVFAALADWQRRTPALPGSFAREVTFGHFEPTYRLTLEMTYDDHGRKTRSKAQRETAAIPPALAEEARRASKPVADIPFEHSGDALERLGGKGPELRRAAEQLLKETARPERLLGRRLVVEHLPAWQATWVFDDLEGHVWFYGKPLRVYLPNPPRRSATPAVALTLLVLALVGAGAWVGSEFDLFGGSAPEAAAPPRPAPRPKPPPLTFAKDGVLQLDDGSFLRGSLERKDDVVRVGGSEDVPTWRIDAVHLDATAFFRGEAKRLDEIEGRVKSTPPATPRETLAALYLELHRQRDRWAKLEPLGAPSEMRRLDALRVQVEKLLEVELIAAVPAATPDAAPKVAAPPPAVGIAAGLLGQVAGAADPDARARLAGGLKALRGEKLPQSDLVHLASLYLSRSEVDAGLAVDRVNLKTSQVDSTFEGVLEKRSEYVVQLRTGAGQEVTAFREKDAWVAQLPGGVRLDNAQCTASPAVRTVSGERLRAALDRLPPSKWMSAPAGEHLRAAKSAAEAVEKRGAAPGDRGIALLRYLAAAHAATALRTGSAAEILEARVTLHALGYAPAAEGRWERAEDRRALQLGEHLRDSDADGARSLLPGPRTPQDFWGNYRTLAALLQVPMRGREDFERAAATLDQALGQASTPPESRHLLTLKAAVAGFGVCAQCGGNAARVCGTCRGKGQRTEACSRCNGLGYIALVGIGARGNKTCESCNGRPLRGSRPCETCEGKGTRSCPRCQGVTRIPRPGEICRSTLCATCGGTGGHGDLVLLPCPPCAGLGAQVLPAGAPDATLR